MEPLDLGLLRRPVDPSGLGHGMPSVPVLAQTPPNRARDHFRILSTTGTRPASVPLPAASPSEFLATPKIRLSQPPITPPVGLFAYPLSASPRPSDQHSFAEGLEAFRCSEERLVALAQGLVQAGLQENPEEKILRTLHHFFKGNITGNNPID